jgi:hypothetical protein
MIVRILFALALIFASPSTAIASAASSCEAERDTPDGRFSISPSGALWSRDLGDGLDASVWVTFHAPADIDAFAARGFSGHSPDHLLISDDFAGKPSDFWRNYAKRFQLALTVRVGARALAVWMDPSAPGWSYGKVEWDSLAALSLADGDTLQFAVHDAAGVVIQHASLTRADLSRVEATLQELATKIEKNWANCPVEEIVIAQ